MRENRFDAVIIGSGFGGAMVARSLVEAGMRVLMLERGRWVQRGPHSWGPEGSLMLTPYYSEEAPYRVHSGKRSETIGYCACVGGPSVFYGAVSMRMREDDFNPAPEILADSGARWPLAYADLEPHYARAEQILNVAGEAGIDPTEPPRSAPYPQRPSALSQTSHRIGTAARALGLHPFRLPLAINYSANDARQTCTACTTCDTFACAVRAKNDLATCVLPGLIRQGLDLRTQMVAVRLVRRDHTLIAVECFDKTTGQKVTFSGRLFILSAGALASPHLLLASDLASVNPAGQAVGRYLMRHCNAIVYGFFNQKPGEAQAFHKQLGIHDFYFGHATVDNPPGKLGTIQQVQTPPVGLVQVVLPRPLGNLLCLGVPHLTGLLVIAEDQPQARNHLTVDRSQRDRFGMPQLQITHRYSQRDLAARSALVQASKKIMGKADAIFCYVHRINTFSHAVGTVRMGTDPHLAPLDQYCRFRGLRNLFVVDGSFMPTSAGINPSLTIAANALRIGSHLAQHLREYV